MGRILQIICGCVLALTLGALQQPDKAGDQQQGQASQKASSRELPAVVPPHVHSDDDDEGCERGQDDRRSDLCAQWKAADAARASADTALYFGFFGLLIGAATLAAAMSAAKWAEKAAKATKESADIAREGVLNVHSAERPYVYFHRTKKIWDDPEEKGAVLAITGVTFINAGRTSAYVTHLIVRARRAMQPPDPKELVLERYPPSAAIFKEEEWPFNGRIPLEIPGEELAAREGSRWFAYGRMVYRDAFGKAYELWFCRVYNGQGSFTFDPETPEMEGSAFNDTTQLTEVEFAEITRTARSRTS